MARTASENESPIGIDRFMDSSLSAHRVPRMTRPERRKGYSAGNKVADRFRPSLSLPFRTFAPWIEQT
jgi:hypothetical protein